VRYHAVEDANPTLGDFPPTLAVHASLMPFEVVTSDYSSSIESVAALAAPEQRGAFLPRYVVALSFFLGDRIGA